MEIVNRTENKLLQRVEIEFRWKHPKQSTPSRQAVIEMVRGLEPGSTQTWSSSRTATRGLAWP